jgi:diguanylate cyclase (GGDEF)-like protein
VDDFKQINDCYGHLIGDTALQFIAKTIKEGVRKSDAVIRYGGDEFVVVFRDIPKSIFEQKLEEIRERVRKLEIDECPEVRLSVSVGGVYEKAKVEEVLKKADAYMYQMKRRKKEMMN